MISDRLTDVLSSLWLTGAQQMSKCDELNPAITEKGERRRWWALANATSDDAQRFVNHIAET
jgi:hypothetical protein